MSENPTRVASTVLKWVAVAAGIALAFGAGYLVRWGCAPAQPRRDVPHPAEAPTSRKSWPTSCGT